VLVFDAAFDFLPVDAEGWIGEHVVEFVGAQLVVGSPLTKRCREGYAIINLKPE
jgi:hypothetical protein